MIKVTKEHVKAYKKAWADNHCSQRAGLEAVMALIDPVPDEVQAIFIRKNDDVFTRLRSGGNVWRAECGCCFYTYAEIAERADDMAGEVTW